MVSFGFVWFRFGFRLGSGVVHSHHDDPRSMKEMIECLESGEFTEWKTAPDAAELLAIFLTVPTWRCTKKIYHSETGTIDASDAWKKGWLTNTVPDPKREKYATASAPGEGPAPDRVERWDTGSKKKPKNEERPGPDDAGGALATVDGDDGAPVQEENVGAAPDMTDGAPDMPVVDNGEQGAEAAVATKKEVSKPNVGAILGFGKRTLGKGTAAISQGRQQLIEKADTKDEEYAKVARFFKFFKCADNAQFNDFRTFSAIFVLGVSDSS